MKGVRSHGERKIDDNFLCYRNKNLSNEKQEEKDNLRKI